MCLDTVYRGKQKREALAKLPDSGYYWKCVYIADDSYEPIIMPGYFKNGWNKTKGCYNRTGYKLAFHLHRTKEAAESWRGFRLSRKVVRCKVEKKDIIHIGKQSGGLCIVTTRFWCPKPKAKLGTSSCLPHY